MLGGVIVPHAVHAECTREATRPGALAIARALEAGWLRFPAEAVASTHAAPPNLGLGESAVIDLALALRVPVLMDDRLGRRLARHLGLTVIGSGGLLLVAKRRGLVSAVRPWLEALRANGYHFSPALLAELLARAGE